MYRLLSWLARSWFGRQLIRRLFAPMSFIIPVKRLRETETLLAFFQPKLAYPFQVLMIPRQPIASLMDLRLPESNTELVLQAEEPGIEVDFLVDDAERAVERFVAAGGTLVGGPFEIEIGRCAVVADLWQNTFVLLDMSRGPLPETRVQDEAGTGGNG